MTTDEHFLNAMNLAIGAGADRDDVGLHKCWLTQAFVLLRCYTAHKPKELIVPSRNTRATI